jgi:hypothetical protein
VVTGNEYYNWQVWVRDAFGIAEYGTVNNSSPLDFSLQPCVTQFGYAIDVFWPWRSWATDLGVHAWACWIWDDHKFVLSQTQLRGVPGTSYSLVKIQVNRVAGARTIDLATDEGGGVFDTSALTLDLPTETPFPTALSGGKVVEVWLVAIMGQTAADWAAAHDIDLEVPI